MFGTRSRTRAVAQREAANKAQANKSTTVPTQRKPVEKRGRGRPKKNHSTQAPQIVNKKAPARQVPPKYLSAANYSLILSWLSGVSQKYPQPVMAAQGSERRSLRLQGLSPEYHPDASFAAPTLQSLVQRTTYRTNLNRNGISLLGPNEQRPDKINKILREIISADNMLAETPTLIAGIESVDCNEWAKYAVTGIDENQVTVSVPHVLKSQVFDKKDLLDAQNKLFDIKFVPKDPDIVDRVSTPKPDYYLGYNQNRFEKRHKKLLQQFETNGEPVIFPFLHVEFKGDGERSAGKLWVATNQCAGASATSLNIIEQLREDLVKKRSPAAITKALEPIVFSVAVNGTEARLFVTYSEGNGNYVMSIIRGFLLYQGSGKKQLDKYLDAITTWGAVDRLKAIKTALKQLNNDQEGPDHPGSSSNSRSSVEGDRRRSPGINPEILGQPPLSNSQSLGNSSGTQPSNIPSQNQSKKRGRGRPRKEEGGNSKRAKL